jgi:hypothetical protein
MLQSSQESPQPSFNDIKFKVIQAFSSHFCLEFRADTQNSRLSEPEPENLESPTSPLQGLSATIGWIDEFQAENSPIAVPGQ